MTLRSLTSLRWHYPDQVVRVFLSLHKEGHPESCRLNLYTFCQLRGSGLLLQARPSGYRFFALYPTLYLSLYPTKFTTIDQIPTNKTSVITYESRKRSHLRSIKYRTIYQL